MVDRSSLVIAVYNGESGGTKNTIEYAKGKRMAWFAVIAVLCVIFTFAGVNILLPGLHSYAV